MPKKKTKATTQKPKSSAHYQRQYRQRLRDKGLVKKEVWVLPEHNQTLLAIEKVLREHHDTIMQTYSAIANSKNKLDSSSLVTTTDDESTGGNMQNSQNQNSASIVNSINQNKTHLSHVDPILENFQWTTDTLYQTLKKAPMFINGNASIELIEGVHSTVYISMHEFGDLPIFLNVTGEQILVESLLFSVDEVCCKERFNELVLRTHKYFPLSTISIDCFGEDGEYYQMFGSLSSTSSLQEILIEIELLAHNVIQATEAYSGFFTTEKIAC